MTILFPSNTRLKQLILINLEPINFIWRAQEPSRRENVIRYRDRAFNQKDHPHCACIHGYFTAICPLKIVRPFRNSIVMFFVRTKADFQSFIPHLKLESKFNPRTI